MRVSRIEVFGFKSFMNRLVLPLGQGITGVVGPNGCGKSNVVDSLRWVLGETRAKSLRGGSLEDVIFNGTDKLRPLGLAEVSITLESSGENFFGGLVSPTLEVERVASGEDGANEGNTTAEKIEGGEESQEAEAGAGESSDGTVPYQASTETEEESRPHLTVIDGNLGKENSPESSEDAPSAEQELEVTNDSDGDDGLGVEEENSQPKSEESKENVSDSALQHKYSWLRSAKEVQVTRRYYRSGESEYFINRVPCRLKDIKELFRAVGLGARAYAIVAQGEMARIITGKPEERRGLLEEASGVQGFRDRISSTERRLKDTSTNISRVEDILKEVKRQVQNLKRQASKAENRARLKEEICERERNIFVDRLLKFTESQVQFQEELTQLESLEESSSMLLSELQTGEEAARNDLMQFDVEGDGLRSKIDSIREEINNRRNQLAQKRSRVNELRAFALAKETELERTNERKKTLVSRLESAEEECTKLEARERELSEELEGLDRSPSKLAEELATELRTQREELRKLEGELRAARDRSVSLKSSLESAEEQLIAASPLNQLKRTLSNNSASRLVSAAGNAELFVDGLQVPSHLNRAVQAVLKEAAGFLVADDPYTIAREFVSLLKDEKRSKGLGLGIFRRGEKLEANGTTTSSSNSERPFPPLLSEINFSEAVAPIAKRYLRDIFVADSLDQALGYFERFPEDSAITVVTLSGELVTSDSFYALQSEGGLLQVKSRIDSLQVGIKEAESHQEELEGRRKTLDEKIDQLEDERAQALKEAERRQTRAREISNTLGTVRGRLSAEKRNSGQAQGDLDRLSVQVQETNARIEELKEEQVLVEAELEAHVAGDESKLQEELSQLNERYSALDEVRKERRTRLSDCSNKVGEARRELDRARSSLSSLRMKIQKNELDLEHVSERFQEEYGEERFQELVSSVREKLSRDLQASVEASDDATRGGAEGEASKAETPGEDIRRLSPEELRENEEQVKRIRARIMREGEVDPESIERLREESERLEDLEVQHEDLLKAHNTLEETMERLVETSKERFMATFTAVRENFSRLVPRLFGGGKGSLELSDPNNPLESGLDIIARPPGKKLKSIELLSGGEKALCATALIFAMFLERPSPLFVLDEVDAPLDEANLQRFLSLVKDMSSKTQILMITHNKQSMAVTDSIIGVTMQEPGSSKFISVSLQEAYSQVA